MQVIAPGKTPRGPSDRVKTDRKDAELLARLLLAGSLTGVVVPPPEVEAAREVTRAHDRCRRDLMNARHRVSKMLLRHGRVYSKSKTWTAEHRRWLSKQQFDEPASAMVFADLLAAVDGLTSRKAAIALRLSELATDERWWPTVSRLRAFRGIDTLTAFSIHLELGADWQRFETAPALSAWLGLTPSLSQSGESSHQGAITKTGSTLARRLLVESAWHYSRQPRLGATLANRQAGQPDHVLAIANRAQQRLQLVDSIVRAALGQAGDDAQGHVVQTLHYVSDFTFFPLAGGIALLMFGLGSGILRTAYLPRPLGYIALAGGVLSLSPLFFIGLPIAALTVLATSIVLAKRPEAPASAGATPGG